MDTLPNPTYDVLSCSNFDTSVSPGSDFVIDSLSQDLVSYLVKLYRKLYPSHAQLFEKGEIYILSTFGRTQPSSGMDII